METKWIGVIAIVAFLVVFVAVIILCRRSCTKNDVESPEEAPTNESGASNVFSISGQENTPFQPLPLQGVIVAPCVSGVSSDHETTIDEMPILLEQRLEGQILDKHSLDEQISSVQSLEERRLEEQGLVQQRLEAQQERSQRTESEHINSLCVTDFDDEVDEFYRREETDPDKTLDLHGLTVAEAMKEFKTFLNEMRDEYDDNYQGNDQFIYVITGWGCHSHDGIGKIKNAVQGYLDYWDISHEWINNDGLVIIDILT
ncbi:hypothetical protein Btru_011965 [Bulinus truncatus]|nr:hypothetical protein Btru_011965 [Bulinus truncatus]